MLRNGVIKGKVVRNMKTDNGTREKLLRSAKEEFVEKGFQNASLRKICSKAGVTTGAVYCFFAIAVILVLMVMAERFAFPAIRSLLLTAEVTGMANGLSLSHA